MSKLKSPSISLTTKIFSLFYNKITIHTQQTSLTKKDNRLIVNTTAFGTHSQYLYLFVGTKIIQSGTSK